MKRALDDIAARAREHLRRERFGQAYAHAVQAGIPLLPAGALVAMLLRAFGAPIDAIATIGVTVLPFAAWIALRPLGTLRVPVARGEALGRVDREMDLHDRLRTADEFLDLPDRGGFMLAAIADATPHLDAFADRSVSLSRLYTGSYPTIPHRTDLTSGRFGWPWYGWQGLESCTANHAPKILARNPVWAIVPRKTPD